jgi:hypothetical protein
MRKSLQLALRFVAVVAVVALIQVALVAPSPAGNPYASALSNVSVGVAYAFPINCPNNSCGGERRLRDRQVSLVFLDSPPVVVV